MNLRHLLAVLVVVAAVVPARAQRESVLRPGTPSPFRLGFEAGPSVNLFAQQVAHSPIQNPTSPMRALASGSGIGASVSLLAELDLAPAWSLQLRLGAEAKRFSTAGSGVADCPTDEAESFDTVSMDVDVTTSARYLTGGLLIQFEPVDRLRLVAGPVVHELAGDVDESVDAMITTPGPCVFIPTGTKEYTAESSTSEGFAARRWGIEAGVSYRIPLTPRIDLVPSARFQYMLDPVSPDGSIDVDDFRYRTLGRLNLHMTDRTLNAVFVGVGLLWTP